MTDFSQLQKAAVTEESVHRFEMHLFAGDSGAIPTLLCRPATEVNKAYFNAKLKWGAKRARHRRDVKVTTHLLATDRDFDRDQYAKSVVFGWENIVDAKGKAVKFSAETCAEFLKVLPDDVFDDCRGACGSASTFRGEVDVEDLAGN